MWSSHWSVCLVLGAEAFVLCLFCCTGVGKTCCAPSSMKRSELASSSSSSSTFCGMEQPFCAHHFRSEWRSNGVFGASCSRGGVIQAHWKRTWLRRTRRSRLNADPLSPCWEESSLTRKAARQLEKPLLPSSSPSQRACCAATPARGQRVGNLGPMQPC